MSYRANEGMIEVKTTGKTETIRKLLGSRSAENLSAYVWGIGDDDIKVAAKPSCCRVARPQITLRFEPCGKLQKVPGHEFDQTVLGLLEGPSRLGECLGVRFDADCVAVVETSLPQRVNRGVQESSVTARRVENSNLPGGRRFKMLDDLVGKKVSQRWRRVVRPHTLALGSG